MKDETYDWIEYLVSNWLPTRLAAAGYEYITPSCGYDRPVMPSVNLQRASLHDGKLRRKLNKRRAAATEQAAKPLAGSGRTERNARWSNTGSAAAGSGVRASRVSRVSTRFETGRDTEEEEEDDETESSYAASQLSAPLRRVQDAVRLGRVRLAAASPAVSQRARSNSRVTGELAYA